MGEYLNSSDSNEYFAIRRKLLQRVVDFTAFNTCYENDIDSAKARICEIKQLVNLKDSVTKQEQLIENERNEKIKTKQQQLNRITASNQDLIQLQMNLINYFLSLIRNLEVNLLK